MKDIELLRQLRKKIDLDKTGWKNPYSTNCYAYALGLDIPECEIMKAAYFPGTISDSHVMSYDADFFSYSQLIDGVYSDLEALGINFREISPLESVDFDEWKIALYTTPSYNIANGFVDFHFLRFCKDDIWHHKMGWTYYPTIYDDNKNVIVNLEDCYFKNKVYNTCLCLKLKK